MSQKENVAGSAVCPRCGMHLAGGHLNSAACKAAARSNRLYHSGWLPVRFAPSPEPSPIYNTATVDGNRMALQLFNLPCRIEPTRVGSGKPEVWTNIAGRDLLEALTVVRLYTRLSMPEVARRAKDKPDLLSALDATRRLTENNDTVRLLSEAIASTKKVPHDTHRPSAPESAIHP